MDVTTTSPIGQVLNESVTNASVYQALNPSNGTNWEHAPQFTRAALIRVYVLSILGIISLVGNVITVSIYAHDCLSLFCLLVGYCALPFIHRCCILLKRYRNGAAHDTTGVP